MFLVYFPVTQSLMKQTVTSARVASLIFSLMFGMSRPHSCRFLISSLLITLFLQRCATDYNLFNAKYNHFPKDYEVMTVSINDHCKDEECNEIIMIFFANVSGTSRNIETLNLQKRFELQLTKEVCHHFTATDRMHYAGLRYCSRHNSTEKEFYGTFFDSEMRTRYDLGWVAEQSQYMLYRYRMDASDSEELHGGRWKPRAAAEETDDPEPDIRVQGGFLSFPVMGHMRHPTIELMVGLESHFSSYFRRDYESLVRFVCMNVISVDAMFRRMGPAPDGIRVKLVGVRDWWRLGFVARERRNPTSHYREVSRFVNGDGILFTGVVDWRGRAVPRHVPGVPDATVTFTHAARDGDKLGLAVRGRWWWGSDGIVIPSYASRLTMNQSIALHHYPTSITTAHEIGHMLTLNHPPFEDTECYTDYGHCIMAAHPTWPLPFWLRSEEEYVTGALNHSHSYLYEQNVRHADVGTVHPYRAISLERRAMHYFLLLASAVFAAWCLVEFSLWNKRRRDGFGYQHVEAHED